MGEHNFRGTLLICDMDGTLLDSKGRVSGENRRAITRFVEGGGLFTVATGRMEKAVLRYLDGLPLTIPAILYNGAVIYDFSKNKVLWKNCLPDSIETVAQKVLDRFPEVGFEVYHGGDIYYVRQNAESERHMREENFIPKFAPLKDIPRPWYKMLMTWSTAKLLEVQEFLKGMEQPFHAVFSDPQYFELLNSSASKGNALKKLAAMLQYPCECIVAMGDNFNDIEMIREAGIGIAVGNAQQPVKDAADLICGHHDRHAVAEVISWIEDGKIKCRAAV